jgi:hypothetical protein
MAGRHGQGEPDAMRKPDLERRVRALGADAVSARWIGRRVDAYLTAMLRRFGLNRARALQRYPLELMLAEVRCASCEEVGRCRRFLNEAPGAPERPSAFCPNARLFRQLRHRPHSG